MSGQISTIIISTVCACYVCIYISEGSVSYINGAITYTRIYHTNTLIQRICFEPKNSWEEPCVCVCIRAYVRVI